jgi:S-adenosylmethionine:tRNA ribosyltransferase-isomerase
MHVADFDFDLPPNLIAQKPPTERGLSRLLVLDRQTGTITHTTISELPVWLKRGDLLVVNNTKVMLARLLGRRVPSRGSVECLLLARLDDERWEALMHPGQKLKPGDRVEFGNPPVLTGEILERRFYGRRTIRLQAHGGRDVMDVIGAIGHVPLPPYIRRPDEVGDRERYQTVYASVTGSVAAPTAGLHFTASLLENLRATGIERAEITLHVGYGTFKPVRSERVEDHVVDPESFSIDSSAATTINRARDERRRIVAVGTTTVRTLESAVRQGGGRIVPSTGLVDLFIYPGFEFLATGGLLTNFHLPRSSLLMLVCAFAGRVQVLAAYKEAIAQGYRFYSYGDAMLVV